MPNEKIKIEKSFTRAKFNVASYNEKERTVDVVFATETLEVKRYDWLNDTYFIEQLVCKDDSVRMKRLNSGGPLLDSHRKYSVKTDVIGSVVSGTARIENGQCVATVKFSQRADVAPVMQDVADGILSNISVGYDVYKYERQLIVKDDEIPTYRAIDWEPYEISLLPVPADIDSGVRSKKSSEETSEVIIVDSESVRSAQQQTKIQNPKSDNMTDLQKRALVVGLPQDTTEAEVIAAERAKTEKAESDKKAVEAAERTRAKEIRTLGTKHNVSVEFIDGLVDDGSTLEIARGKILDKLAESQESVRSNVAVTGKDEKQKDIDAKIAALTIRSAQLSEKEITKEERELAQKYRGHSLLDFARMALESNDIKTTGLDKMEIAKRALQRSSISTHSTDFPVLLEGTNRRILLASYQATADKWRQFCSIGSVSDFREWKRLRFGSLSRLDALNENGEYKNKKITDAEAESISVKTFGNTINISRVMIVNDDLKAFTDLTKALGRAAARSIEIDVFGLFAQNSGAGPTMADGIALFHADHNNLISSGGVPSVTEFDKMRVAMASQKEKDGNDFLDLLPSIWLGPIGLDGDVKVVNGALYDPDAPNKLQRPNKVNGLFSQIVGTPRLSGKPYYAFANPSDEPVIEVAFLDGNQNPFLESEAPFDTDGLKWKVRLDYGVGAVGFRGVVKNPGE